MFVRPDLISKFQREVQIKSGLFYLLKWEEEKDSIKFACKNLSSSKLKNGAIC
jgi:molybdenum-dependent DNA-binding transcriptional regulator ModE